MAEDKKNSINLAAVPDETQKALLSSSSDVQTRVGPVAKFNEGKKFQEEIILDEFDSSNPNGEFLGLTKEELKEYIESAKWKKIRLIVGLIYLSVIVLLLLGSAFLVVTSPRCPPKKELNWFQREIIYEVDVPVFFDSDSDGVGDLQGLAQKISYLEKNRIQSVLLQSTIFNVSIGKSTILDGKSSPSKKLDLLRIDPKVGTDLDLEQLTKQIMKKNMHLIVDLPLSSTFDPNGIFWYGNSSFSKSIQNPCVTDKRSLGCLYYDAYGRLPLDFNNNDVSQQAEKILQNWLTTKKVDGVRVDLPLELNELNVYEISEQTIDKWINLKKSIEAKSKTKLLLFDVPSALRAALKDENLPKENARPIYFSSVSSPAALNARQISNYFEKTSKTSFWKLGSKRRSDELGIPQNSNIPREILFTLMLLSGPTPILLYGDELSIDQKNFPFMSWTSDAPSAGFTACKKEECPSFYKEFVLNPLKTSVKRQEAVGAQSKDSLLNVFRRLSALREKESFRFGNFQSGHEEEQNLFWFVREAPGHKGFVVLVNLNENESAHVSLHDLTSRNVPLHLHYEYQWPKAYFSSSDTNYIHSDNLNVDPKSINIFWWKAKPMEKRISFS